MAVKTTIDSRGVVTETIAGSSDILVVNDDQTITTADITAADISGTKTLDQPFTILNPGAAGLVTGSLPTVGSDVVGARYLILKDNTSGVAVLSGSANQKIVTRGQTLAAASQELHLTTLGPTSTNSAIDLVATVSGSTYFWVVIAGSGSTTGL